MIQARMIDPVPLITHHFTFDKMAAAYENFGHAETTGALKVIIDVAR